MDLNLVTYCGNRIGTVSDTGHPRLIQFALKLMFQVARPERCQ
jgi:hypothetical protein